MKKDNENFPESNMGRMMVLTLDEYRDGIVGLYSDILGDSIGEMLIDGNCPKMLSQGVKHMDVHELKNEASIYAGVTMDMDDSLDGIIVWDGEDDTTAVIIATRFKD